ncbi:MAG: hypothetical protein JO033_12300, partial [Acidobacteriaceae bacterium]|nr:hypothetical protein [Acidobacteriaceae bacterium]
RRHESTVPQAPLYIRWAHLGAAYAIELKLELVSLLLGEVARAEKARVETGGVLIGWVSHMQRPPTLCVEGIAFAPRSGETGSVATLRPGDQWLRTIRERARAQGHAVVGIFRTQLRSEPLIPIPADRGMVTGEFPQSVCALLLIQGLQPYSGAFFVAADGRLPDEPTVREFRLDQDEFNALPEVYRNQGLLPAEAGVDRRLQPRYDLLALALLLIAALLAVALWRERSGGSSSSTANQLGLKLSSSGGLLKISWDHTSRAISNAQGATLVIQDGRARTEAKIGSDELRAGSVEYQSATPHVNVTMSVDLAAYRPQSAQWTQRQ